MLLPSILLLSLLADLPMPHYDWKACPGEYCCYGKWRARKDVGVYATQAQTRRPLFVLKRGTRVTTMRGVVVTRKSGLVELLEPMRTEGRDSVVIPRGTVIRTLYYHSEGYWVFEYEGRSRSAMLDDPKVVRALTEPEYEWWVELKTSDGRTGWAIQHGTFDLECSTAR